MLWYSTKDLSQFLKFPKPSNNNNNNNKNKATRKLRLEFGALIHKYSSGEKLRGIDVLCLLVFVNTLCVCVFVSVCNK